MDSLVSAWQRLGAIKVQDRILAWIRMESQEFISRSYSEACTTRDYFFLYFFTFFLCLQTFMNCGRSVMSICLFNEVKQQWGFGLLA